MNANVLIVDDDANHCEYLAHRVSRMGYSADWTDSPDAALAKAESQDYDAVLADLNMPEYSGFELCERLSGKNPDVPVIVVTGHGSLDAAVGAIRVGAYDFLTKPVDHELLSLSLRRALQHRKLRDEVKRLQAECQAQRPSGELIGESQKMNMIGDLIARVGPSDASVLICGESGTGKELVARALHNASERRDGPFIAINCAAVPASLIESELFGHVRGAFTDARENREGIFAQAHRGTVFLDEIGELPIEIQPKLLRALQEKKVRQVGGSSEISFDARVLTATNRDLEAEVANRQFREDLFYRINVIRVDVPPLRDRGGDILLLARHFLSRFAERSQKPVQGITEPAAQKLLSYSWPGNVRELENAIERAVTLTQYEKLVVDDLPEKVRDYSSHDLLLRADDAKALVTISELESRYIARVLRLVEGNKSRAAKLLGIDRRTLYRKLERLEEDVAEPAAVFN